MELEHYFEFLPENYIRIKGTRLGLEQIVQNYREGASPEEIVLRFPSVKLEQVYATITYYLAKQAEIDQYIQELDAEKEAEWQEQQQNPSEALKVLRGKIEAARQKLYLQKLIEARN